nr:reverse transcriptase domain-containing protein [Tanacetum cinerariifolium]GEX76118.1 reverse transcriptase domain-containing protein [Tanacetum cinerariifolium]GEX76502.1 reverse transcriptase domain-containing protein [Tanacetum cinerariifolium]
MSNTNNTIQTRTSNTLHNVIMEAGGKDRPTMLAPVIAKVSTSSSIPVISSDVAELKDMVRASLLDKKNQSSAPAHSPTPAPVKAVEPNCVTCGGGNFNQGQLHRPQVNQAPIPQTQSVSKTDFESYVKANDAVLRNIQNQGQILQIQMANLTDMLSKFVSSNTASSSGSGTLLSNTITNPKEDLKVSSLMPNLKSSTPYPSRRDNERRRDQANEQIEKFYEIFKDMTLADIGASINLMPLSMWEGLSLLELTPTCMTLELADRSVSKPIGIAKNVPVKDDITASGNPTPYDDPIVSTTSPTLTLFGDNDVLLFEEADAFLGLEDGPNSPEFNPFYYDPEGEFSCLNLL